ncbi:BAP_1a_G0004960.mRNA.1.CDS.1 [Saccharomyces cerevisiae]|nr:BAP_1a_G0004960.mRNA.1.CDS.1 [Saccharomyces cerevisiae]CAI7052028.1 BAP_1a_G0004960.mRNA.1.CDS.1 [Saccharomyces cerevisiae]
MLKSSKHKVLPKSKDGNYGSIEETEIPSVDYSEDLDEDLDKGEDIALSRIPNLWIIEATLFSNVFLSGFDGTVTASTYQTIGNEFNQMSISNWITTAYLITSTSFQPLYGSFSDALGRRNCLFFANGAFTIGCLACGFSKNIYMLSFMRALTGIGGGGLITLSTIVNSDVIPSSKRGIFQAFQNLLLGFGAICGASFGGTIASSIGWRWCFLIQVPISVISSILMNYYVPNQKEYNRQNSSIFQNPGKILRDIDVMGSILIITGLTLQLLYLSLGCSTSKLSWTSPSVLLLLVGSVVILLLFILHERKTSARAIIPMELVNSSYSVVVLSISILVGFASYAYLFTLPLFFQIVLGDSTAKAGLRLTIPSLFTPVGSLITGFSMSKYNCLRLLLYIGISLMFLGNFFFLFIEKTSPNWLIGLFLIPANLGQGITFPTTLFTFIFMFSKSDQATATSTLYLFRSIGSVWGVAISAGVIQLSFAELLRSNLKGLLDENKIKKLIVQLSANSSYIGSLHGEVKNTVIKSFDEATKRAHLMSTLLSLLALILCILKDNLAKPKTRR